MPVLCNLLKYACLQPHSALDEYYTAWSAGFVMQMFDAGSNLVDAQQTVECIKEDVGALPHLHAELVGAAGLERLLQDRGCRYLSFKDWSCIDAVEVSRGQLVGKPREKFTSAAAMLACLSAADNAKASDALNR